MQTILNRRIVELKTISVFSKDEKNTKYVINKTIHKKDVIDPLPGKRTDNKEIGYSRNKLNLPLFA